MPDKAGYQGTLSLVVIAALPGQLKRQHSVSTSNDEGAFGLAAFDTYGEGESDRSSVATLEFCVR